MSTDYNAGTARATYALDASPFQRELANARRAWQQFQREQASSQGRAPARANPAPRAFQDDVLALARAQARLAAAEGDAARGAAILRGALAGTNQETRQALAARTQLANLERRAAAETRGSAGAFASLTRTVGGFGQALGAIGFAVGIQQLAAFTAQAIAAANQLEDVEQSLRIVARDQATYNATLQAARDAQRLFGGSLAENIGDLQGFVLTSRTAGVSLDQLILTSRQLALLDPAQGLRGASVALREFLSGNPRSLAQRFELPASVVRALGDESSTTAEKLEALSDYLGEAGITAEAIQGRLENTSQAYRDLGVAGEQAYLLIGRTLADLFEPVARFGTLVLGQVGQLNNVAAQNEAFSARVLAGASSFEEYAERVAAAQALADEALDQAYAGDPLGRLVAQALNAQAVITELTRGQFAFAQVLQALGADATAAEAAVRGLSTAQLRYADGLIAQGAAAADAATRARELGSAIDAANAVQGRLFDDAGASSDQLQFLGDTMLQVAGRSAEARAEVERLAAEYLNGRISSNELEDAVLGLADAQDRAAVQARIREEADRALEEQARLTARALLDAGVDGEAAAARLAASGDRVDQLTAKYLRLGVAAEAALGRGAAASGLAALGRGVGGTGTDDGTGKGQDESVLAVFRRTVAAERAAEEAKEAERRRKAATREAAKDANEAERAREAARREQERRAEEVDRALTQIEQRTEDHYRRLRQSEEDYQTDSARAREDFDRERRRLLAEGRIAEAQALTAEFELEERRRREDRDRDRLRQREDLATDVSRIAQQAELAGPVPLRTLPPGGAVPGVVPVAVPAVVPGVGGAPAQQTPLPPLTIDLRVPIAPLAVEVDGGQIVEATYPDIRALIKVDLATGEINIDNPTVSGQVLGVRGP